MTGTAVCVVCEGEARRVEAMRPVKVGRRSVRVLDAFMQCAECGEEYYLPGQMEESQRRATAALAAGSPALDPAEVRAIRQRLGVTQGELERLLGVGPKTVVRWERGTVRPNAATDRLLRIVRDVPGAADYLAAEHGVELPRAGGPEREVGGTVSAPAIRSDELRRSIHAWASASVQVVQHVVDVSPLSERHAVPIGPAAPTMTRNQTIRRHLEEIANEHDDVATLVGV